MFVKRPVSNGSGNYREAEKLTEQVFGGFIPSEASQLEHKIWTYEPISGLGQTSWRDGERSSNWVHSCYVQERDESRSHMVDGCDCQTGEILCYYQKRS